MYKEEYQLFDDLGIARASILELKKANLTFFTCVNSSENKKGPPIRLNLGLECIVVQIHVFHAGQQIFRESVQGTVINNKDSYFDGPP